MKRSHEQIERLLGETPSRAHASEGFVDGVTRAIAGTKPGSAPVARWAMPASMKACVALGAVGVVSAAVWVGSSGSPAPDEPGLADRNHAPDASPQPDTQAIAALSDLFASYTRFQARETGRKPVDVIDEGRRLVSNARQLGLSFLSAFPSSWTEMLLGDGLFSGGRTPEAPGPTTEG
ncbi:MAG: hypothetical protein ACF8Q5_04210 [Phycisphaerales bacterium JB040]